MQPPWSHLDGLFGLQAGICAGPTLGLPNVLVCLGWRGFLECGTLSIKARTVLGKQREMVIYIYI